MSVDIKKYPLLATINSPSELQGLDSKQLPELCSELRGYLIDTLNICGGHFAANLGAVELTVALHYLYNTPDDKLIWDVGHQAYPHKILTGRRDQLQTIRQPQGLSPFCKRAESEHDAFGVGHSSTAISAGLGMALANELDGGDKRVVAIIGDGGMTGGMAFEALNHLGSTKVPMLVVLNDNDMSISPNIGGLTNYLTKIISSKTYTHIRESSKTILSKLPAALELAKKTETHMKGMVAAGTMFEELGLNYIGPIDGHDINTLVKTLKNIRHIKGPVLLHVRTTKGKGYPAAEEDPVGYHAVKPGFNDEEKSASSSAKKPTYSQVFGQWLCDIAEQDPRLVAITPAMCEGSGMVDFAIQYPERFFDVSIAEQHSVTLAAGFACEGKKPVVAIYSTFLQRAYDQLIHDVALQNLDVTFAIDRAGLVGADGPTHAGSFDLSYLRCIPNMMIAAPADENECRQLLYTAWMHEGPSAVRYPRGTGPGITPDTTMQALPIGKSTTCRIGKEVAILNFGALRDECIKAGETLDATVIDMRFVKPLDTAILDELIQSHSLIVTVEENAIQGGAGSAVNEYLANKKIKLLNLGLPDEYIEHGDPKQMLADCGLDADGIMRVIKS